MRKTLTIGEISDILNIPTATLRFWENEDLIHVAKGDNKYRAYTTTDLISIADIQYYRNLGVPVKQIKEFTSVGLADYGSFLQDQENQLNEKIQEYRQMLQRTEHLERNYYQLLKLLVKPFVPAEPDFNLIISWDFREKDRIRKYISDPSYYVWCKDTNKDHSGHKGLIVSKSDNFEFSALEWEKTAGKKYITFPIKAMIDDDYKGLEAPDIVAHIQCYTATGMFIARHLLNCTEDGKNVEYLQAYLEITGEWDPAFAQTLKQL